MKYLWPHRPALVWTADPLTLVFDVEVAGDEGRGLTPDPRGERFSGLDPVVFYHLDLHSRGRRKRRKGEEEEEEGGEGKL